MGLLVILGGGAAVGPRGSAPRPRPRSLQDADLAQPVALGAAPQHQEARRERSHGEQPASRENGGSAEGEEPGAGGDRKEVAPCSRGLQLPAAPAAAPAHGRRDATMAAAAVAAPEPLGECGCKGMRTCLVCERQRGEDASWRPGPQVGRASGRCHTPDIHRGERRPRSPIVRLGGGAGVQSPSRPWVRGCGTHRGPAELPRFRPQARSPG